MPGFRFKNLSVDAMGAGQLDAPGRNYSVGDVSGISFENFTIAGESLLSAADARFEFDQGAGDGFSLNGEALTVGLD